MLAKALFVLGMLAGCTVGSGEPYAFEKFEDIEAGIVVLEGDELAYELTHSPVHEATEELVRIGLIFDAPTPTSLQLATSPDGVTWSAWTAPVIHHVEQETTAGFVGQIELPDGASARYYRLRGAATFVRIEEMVFRQSAHIESGEDGAGPDSTALVIGGPNIEVRSSWGARAPSCSSSLGKVFRIAIHHTESPTVDKLSPQARLRQIQSYHMNVKGWCDIGYHYLISRDGRVWEGRPDHKLGSHAGGANTGNIGISVMGSHDTIPVTEAQAAAMAELIRTIGTTHKLTIDRKVIRGHREYKSTSCPGDRLFGQLDEILQRARAETPTQTPPPPPPEESPTLVSVRGILYAGDSSTTRLGGATIAIGGRTTTTDASGAWELETTPGSFTVTASKAGYLPRTLTRTTDGAQTWASFGLSTANAPTGTAILQGVVYHGTNSLNRIPYASVTLSTGHAITADANGYYKLGSLPGGTVTITASAPGYATASVSRSLISGVTEWGSVKLAP